jgi:GntR family transcriptional regulator
MSATLANVGNVTAGQRHGTMIIMSLPDKRDRIDHRAPKLLWQQVADDLRSELASGELAADARLPGELELADQYGVSRDTIRRAIQELVSEDRLVVLHGRGTFVKPAGKPSAGDTSSGTHKGLTRRPPARAGKGSCPRFTSTASGASSVLQAVPLRVRAVIAGLTARPASRVLATRTDLFHSVSPC